MVEASLSPQREFLGWGESRNHSRTSLAGQLREQLQHQTGATSQSGSS